MAGHLSIWTLLTVSAGLLCGSAVRAQGISQSTNVTYAVTLVDAQARLGNGAPGPVTDTTDQVRVQVTVSVPRTGGVDSYTVPNVARPAGLMFRAHNGADGTAWAHSISLTPDAPHNAAGDPLGRLAFYPMPQKTELPDLTAVLSGSPNNLNNIAYAGYVKAGRGHDPARWEATYLSAQTYTRRADGTWGTTAAENALVDSLLKGEATQEWYVASEYGLGSFARISPIQDLGRAMDFTDLRLWEGAKTYGTVIDAPSQASLGNFDDMRLRAMPGRDGAGWRIVRGAIGANAAGQIGAQLFNEAGNVSSDDATRSDSAAIESPTYPDGIASVSFVALASSSDEATDGSPQRLELYYKVGAGQERKLADFELTTGARTYSADFVDGDGKPLAKAGSGARFFLRRATTNAGAGQANLSTIVVRNLRVRSAAPAADFGEAVVATLGSANRPWAGEPFTVSFGAVTNAVAASIPRGYAATLRLRRRAEGDATALWRKAPMAVEGFTEGTGSATLKASFAPGSLLTNAGDGSVNAAEGAFFTDVSTGEVTGVMPGVYDMALDYDVYGSFRAGREQMDGRETVSGTKTGVTFNAESGQDLIDPYLLDVRERRTVRSDVTLRVMYKGRADDGEGSAIRTLDVPCLPSSTEDNVWRVALPRTLRLSDYGLPDDEAAEYAWGYQASTNEPPTFIVGHLPFTVVARRGEETEVYGQDGKAAEGLLPPVSEAVPAITQQLVRPAAAEDAVPVVVPLDGLESSHVLAEVVFGKEEGGASVRLSGAYWQDFNTWFAANGFGATEFRENVASVTTGFNCTTTTDGSGTTVVDRGWIPDEGPLAESTSFTETFEMSRESQTDSGLPFALPNMVYQGTQRFAMWGAAPEAARPYLLRPDHNESLDTSLYMEFGNNTELVANRSWERTASGSTFLPDAQVRLRDGAGSLTPRSDGAGVTLNGVGTVSFRLGLSLPYDINGIAQFRNKDGSLIGDKWGVSAGIAFDSGSTALNATSGYSVSYYLVDDQSGKKYELRLTQILSFDDRNAASGANEDEPVGKVVAELYEWTRGQEFPSRMAIGGNSGTGTASQGYIEAGQTLSSMRAALWVRADGTLAAGWVSGNLTGIPSAQMWSTKAVGSETGLTPALGAAECRPIFRSIDFAGQRAAAYSASFYPTVDNVYVHQPDNGTSWQLTTDASGASRSQLRRATPSKDKAGRVRIRASGDTKETIVSTTSSGETFTVTLGSAKGRLTIVPVDRDSVFLDNITVTSWRGNDYNRNGETRVPRNTDVGFHKSDGFAGVGIWIRPEEDDQLGVSPAEYAGRQCVLLQRSRRNTSYTSDETTEGGSDGATIRHTGSTLALYSPWSDTGFGTVSFRYRIPQLDEYGSGRENPSVSLMLQYKETQTANLSWLDANPGTNWRNVSAPFDLENTAGAWRSMSITPKLDGQELVGRTGNLRIVMVTTGLDDTADPYVYLDDLTFTDNRGTSASWSATNVKLTDSPIDLLYWKDRAATEGAVPEETDFAHKSALTRAMQFNDVMTDGETEGTYGRASLTSPMLSQGVGRVSFAARRTDASPEPARVYFEVSTDVNEDSEAVVWETLTYVDVTNTVYRVFDVDLTKFRKTLTPIDPTTLLPGTPAAGSAARDFDYAAVRRLRLRTRLENDNGGDDPFGDAPRLGRVLLDALTVANPVTASLRVRSVMFSNLAGTGTAGFERQLARLAAGEGMSPLSQPVSGTSALRALVALDRMQQVRSGSVRVFLTYDTSLTVARRLTGYSYTDVLGNQVSASGATPIYTLNDGQVEAWPLDAWFDKEAMRQKVANGEPLPNTVELFKAEDSEEASYFVGDLSKTGIPDLSSNALVRYVAWAVYESAEDAAPAEGEKPRTFVARQEASSYTEFPWYFPRSLNAELRARHNAANPDDPAGATFFSPYFWVYSCLPGEVFLNEFNLRDHGGAIKLSPFVELCAPVDLDIAGWRVEATGSSTAGTEVEMAVAPGAEGETKLLAPEVGVVPAKRTEGTSAGRAFYTLTDGALNSLYYREGAGEVPLAAGTQNAGTLSSDAIFVTLGGSTSSASLRLLRPTGGAEHIVVFSNVTETSATTTWPSAQQNIDRLHDLYRNAYINHGFGGEWAQEFIEEDWETLSEGDPDGNVSKADHARRLAKADVFVADSDGDYLPTGTGTERHVQDNAREAFANSVATVDMGGKWVTRLNHVNEKAENGPTDMTGLIRWTGDFNPTTQARPGADGADVQVTPRQVNPNQYLFRYTGLNQNTVSSSITGLGTHKLVYATNVEGGAAEETVRQAGNAPQVTWSVGANVGQVSLTYTPFPFHGLDSVTLRLMDAKEGLPVTDEGKIRAAVQAPEAYEIADDGLVTFTLAVPADPLTVTVSLQGAADDERYNLELAAAFSLRPEAAQDVLTSVRPYCGNAFPGTANEQPWWGSSFGFAVDYDEAAEGGDLLTSVLVTYPSPVAPDYLVGPGADALGHGLSGAWSGSSLTVQDDTGDVTYGLNGQEYSVATNLLATVFAPKAGTRFVELRGASGGRVADSSLVGILSDAYAKAAGYKADDVSTYAKKEPAIPYCAWGVYTVPVVSDSGSAKVSFLVRQPSVGTGTMRFEKPHRYEPLRDLNEGRPADAQAPYFYLYSTPPQSAWLSELNLVQASSGTAEGNSEPYAEVVMPILRAGITNAVPPVAQTDTRGWSLSRYDATGAELASGIGLDGATAAPSSSASYSYHTVALPQAETSGQVAYVLRRPCGAAEGGVWTGVSDKGGQPVAAPASLLANGWLLPAADTTDADGVAQVGTGSYVVPGVTDSGTEAGSVQLTGVLGFVEGIDRPMLSSDVTKRMQWTFLGETRGTDNGADGEARPDVKPEWNQVTVTSSLRNTVYGGTACGYHVFGFLEGETASGASGIDVELSQTLGGPEWVYSADKAKVFSYRPRSNYRFESLQVPQDLIGKIMLIGASGPLSEEAVQTRVAELRALADAATSEAAKAEVRTRQWLQMGQSDPSGRVRAKAETRLEYDEDGVPQEVFTGVIRFDPDFVQGSEDGDTFGNDSEYTITVVFAEEPASAQNAMVMSFGQGEIRAGAWLLTQTLFAMDEEGAPIGDKGGVAVEDPIWSDEGGTAGGDYANLHGWLHQPTVGDRIGMAAVISPEDGLRGGNLADPYGMLASKENPALRPYLVWTLIPKAKVPGNLFSGTSDNVRSAFLKDWDLTRWLTNGQPLPTVGDRNTYSFSAMRKRLREQLAYESSLFSAAGLIPMVYTGKNSKDVPEDEAPTTGALHFRTVATQEELDGLGLPTAEGELPLSPAIEMADRTLWQDGAVARFAIVLVGTADGLVYDCQSVSNFSSEAQPAYCPWYVPDASSNVNVVTRREQAGVSPYFWVYAIGQGDVWINEFRPFAVGKGAPSAFELAMKADTGATLDEQGRWVASKSLDGWKVAVKAAPMPTPLTETATLDWISSEDATGPLAGRSVPLKGWIPFRRIRTQAEGDEDPTYYNLDYYTATTDASEGILEGDNSLPNAPYDPANPDSLNTFQWLRMAQDLLPEGITETLEKDAAYSDGVVYALQLIRANGVVADEVLFFNKVRLPTGAGDWEWKNRLARALRMESEAGQCAGDVRAVPVALPVENNLPATATAQFVEAHYTLDGQNFRELRWFVDPTTTRLFTLPGPNRFTSYLEYYQPYADYAETPDYAQRLAALTARLVGGDARLSLTAGTATASGRNVGGLYSKGVGYTLAVEGWDPRWFDFKGVTKNGADHAPPAASRRAVYALASNGAVRRTEDMLLDIGTLERDTDYSVVFVYTPEAALLEASGALESTDGGFLAWLREAAPEAILGQSAADGVSASEKYWLGFSSADWDASDVALAVTAIGMQAEPAAESQASGPLLPTLTLRLAKGEAPVGSLRGDGVVVLLGKSQLGDAWRFVRELRPADLTGESTLVVATDCRFFKAVLLSRKALQEMVNE